MSKNNYVFDNIRSYDQDSYENASVSGISIKTGILMVVAFMAACLSIIFLNAMSVGTYFFYAVAIIGTVVLQLVISFKPHTAKSLSIPYVICEGIVIGVICDLLELVLPGEGLGIAGFALMVTLGILLGSVILYTNRRIRLSSTFLKIFFIIIIGISLGSAMFSIMSLLLYFISGINLWAIYLGSSLSIIVSVIMVIVASIYVYFNIQEVDDMVKGGMSKKYEWYAAFGLAMSVIWLFMEILRLLIRLAARRDD